MRAAPETSPSFDLPARTVLVEGARIAFRRRGPRNGPPLLLVHGSAGHMGWWFGVAPVLAERHDVTMVDLSGHGDSDHRPAYDSVVWVRELAAVIDALGRGPAVVVAHSAGGHTAALLASTYPDSVQSVVLVDTRLESELPFLPAIRPARFYPTRDEGLANFRLRPRGTSASPALLERVAEYGLGRTTEGWRWKFDPSTGAPLASADIARAVAGLSCPIGVLYGELSDIAGATSASFVTGLTGRPTPQICIPGAFHHVPLDAPDATAAAVQELLAGW